MQIESSHRGARCGECFQADVDTVSTQPRPGGSSGGWRAGGHNRRVVLVVASDWVVKGEGHFVLLFCLLVLH